jgi:hypothetical protein
MGLGNMKIKLVIAILAASGFVLFQNCSMSTMHSESGSFDTSTIMNTADVSWTIRAQKGVSLSRLSQANRWTDRTGGMVSLFPPLMPNSTQADMSKAPYLVTTSSGPLMSFSDGTYLTTQVGDANLFTGQAYSTVLYVRNLVFPQTAFPRQVRIFELIPEENGAASGWIGIDFYQLEDGRIQVNAFQYYGNGTATVYLVRLPASSLSEGFGVAARFAVDPAQVFLSVNGADGELVTAGSPPVMANVNRRLFLSSQYIPVSGFDMAEFGLWKREFSPPETTYFSRAIKEVIERGGTALVNPGSVAVSGAFAAVQSHFSSCTECHSVGNAQQVRSNAGGVLNPGVPWVVPGNSAGSLLMKSLRHQAGADPMPRNRGPLSATALTAIAAWIDGGAN